MIAGQSPRIRWQANPEGERRTIEEALEIATKHGVVIPKDVHFSIDQLGDLGDDLTARGPRVDKYEGSIVHWSDLVGHQV